MPKNTSWLNNGVFYEKTKDGDQYVDVFARLVKDRVIWLNSDINTEVASVVSSLLFMMDKEDDDEKISIWINSPGGDIYGFYTIYDMIQMIKAPVETICIGKAFSAGAFLLMSGTKGMRFATPNSRIMIHQVQIDGVGGTGTEVEIEAKEIKYIKKTFAKIVSNHTGKPERKCIKDLEYDNYFSPQEAIKYGIIDGILPYKK
jgi:ATP-dependent Clp protease protease subunit